MSQDDPFTDLLEGSLAVPDFDLGAELRGRLLAAAEEVSSPKVVALVTEESWEVSAFNWLLGEQATDVALMDRLILNPVFATGVSGQQTFLRRLRQAMRQPAVVEPVRIPALSRMRTAMMASAGLAAVIAWLLVVMMPFAPKGSSSGESAALVPTDANQKPDGRTVPLAARERSDKARSVEGFAETTSRKENAVGGLGRRNFDWVRSGEAVLEFSEATQLAARELFHGTEDSFGGESIPLEPGMEALLASNVANSVQASTSTESADWMFNRGLLSSGQGLFPNQSVAMIPEPSGMLLTAIGTLILIGRRRRPDQTI